MKRKYREYTDEDVIQKAKEVYSMTSLLKAIGLKPEGSNYLTIKKLIQKLNIDTSHWTGKGWSKDKQLKDWTKYVKMAPIRKHLIQLRGNICDCCKNTEWLGKPIKLEIHHINGDKLCNEYSNLQLLCPNCHSFTETWRSPWRDLKSTF